MTIPPFTVYVSIYNRNSFLNVKHFLKKKGFHIVTTPAEFTFTIRQQPVHALIFDAEAFFTNGNDILRICGEENKLPGFPMIFISDKYELDNPLTDEQAHPRLHRPFKLNELERILYDNLDIGMQNSASADI